MKAPQYTLIEKALARMPEINERAFTRAIEQIDEDGHALRVWVFGSRARRDHDSDSDLDLFFTYEGEGYRIDVMLDMHRAVDPIWDSGTEVDLVFCPASLFDDRAANPQTPEYDVVNEGVLVYDRG